MAVIEQSLSDTHAVYNGDSCEVLPSLPGRAAGLVIYSPPFSSLYHYSSSERDLSNCPDYPNFLEHYGFVVRQCARLTRPGRVNCVHCADIPIPGQREGYADFPGDIIRLHAAAGFWYMGRISIWKEPRRVALRTRLQHLTHRNIARDSSVCFPAGADWLLLFRRHGENEIPIAHPVGLSEYYGEREIPHELQRFRGETRQEKNRLSQWIWRNYASSQWDDIRIDRVLPYKLAKEKDEEKHVCPLQLDVIERCLTLWSNPGDVVLTPFLGVGSEVCGALVNNRKAIGVELKSSYYRQALKNIERVLIEGWGRQDEMLPMGESAGEASAGERGTDDEEADLIGEES
jgi:DNA modification methylase